MHLLFIHVSTLLFISTICEKKYEIVACIIDVWGHMESHPNIVTQAVKSVVEYEALIY